jgi:hypothetical protein
MTRYSIIVIGVALAALAAGCESPSSGPSPMKRASSTAQLTAAEVEVANGADRNEATAKTRSASSRDSYLHDTRIALAELDASVAKLNAREAELIGQEKADMDERLARIRATRAALAEDFTALEAGAHATWDQATTRVDHELADLRALIDHS